jgi:D-3-phosphoglycerate dehydrogenase
MVDRRTLGLMKPSAYLINCARGGVVNEDDLYDAVKNETISGAAMDVFMVEPARPDNKLFSLDRFIASPHSAGLTKESVVGVALSCARAVDDVLNGRAPQYPVNGPF